MSTHKISTLHINTQGDEGEQGETKWVAFQAHMGREGEVISDHFSSDLALFFPTQLAMIGVSATVGGNLIGDAALCAA